MGSGLFEKTAEPRPLITMFGVLVEARAMLTGLPEDYNPYQIKAAQLFKDALAVPPKNPSLSTLGVAAKRYGGHEMRKGGDVATVYFIRLGVDGGVSARSEDLVEANWVMDDRFYALGVPPGTYAVAAVVLHAVEDISFRGMYYHQAFFLDEKGIKDTTMTVGPGEHGVAGEVSFKPATGTPVQRTDDHAWKDAWKGKGHVRNLKAIMGKYLVYRSRVPEELGIDSAKMLASFTGGADAAQQRNRNLLAADSGFPLCGLPDDLEVDRTRHQQEGFLDDQAFDLKHSPWGDAPVGEPAAAPAAEEPSGAVSEAPTASAVSPGDAPYREAAALYAAQDIDGAWRKAYEALQADPRHWQSWQLIGNCQLAKGDRSRAIQSYRNSLAINSDNQPLREWLAQSGG